MKKKELKQVEQKLHTITSLEIEEYAKFCVRCDRQGLQLLNFESYKQMPMQINAEAEC